MTNFKPNDNLEYIRALTGPTLVKDEEEQPRLPTLILGDGLKLTTNLALRTHRLDVEGGADEWSEHPATQDVDLDGFKITGLGEPTDASDAATKAYVDAQSGGGGPTDRIESPSGAAFVESTDDYGGTGWSASVMRAATGVGYATVETYVTAYNTSEASLVAGPLGGSPGSFATLYAGYNLTTGSGTLGAYGAPFRIEEPVANNHAATKGYIDSRPGADAWSEHPATQDVDLGGHKITGLGEPTDDSDAATKAYVDSITGLNSTIAEGELTLTLDPQYSLNVAYVEVSPLRYTRIGRTVTLSGSFQLISDSGDGVSTVSFTGITGAALPAASATWRGVVLDSYNDVPKSLATRVTTTGYFGIEVSRAEASRAYRGNFAMTYKSAT